MYVKCMLAQCLPRDTQPKVKGDNNDEKLMERKEQKLLHWTLRSLFVPQGPFP